MAATARKQTAGYETEDYAQFKAFVQRKTGIDLNQYKQEQMYRRLLSMVERTQSKDFMDFYRLIERDASEYAIFLNRMTINISELFRNPEKWKELRELILPTRLAAGNTLKVWSAGCSYGAEPYSLAILLEQLTPGVTHSLHATDLDNNILRKAVEARFSSTDIRNLDADTVARCFDKTASGRSDEGSEVPSGSPIYRLKSELRSRVNFSPHNLLTDPFQSDYDLICCRNVVIYFTEEAKQSLFERFYQALAPGGVLFVGGTERIYRYREMGFNSTVPFFYCREA